MRTRPVSAATALAVLCLVASGATTGAQGSRAPSSSPAAPGAVQARRLHVPAIMVMSTLVGYRHDTPPPWPRGNCFSLSPLSRKALEQARKREAERARRSSQRGPIPRPRSYEWEVLNMHTENFQRIVAELKIKTIEIERVGAGYCLIVDARIPREWFLERPCPQCTPASLQQDLRSRHADRFRRASP